MNLKDEAKHELSSVKNLLLDISHKIHAHPELAFHEFKACAWLVEVLKQHNFIVEENACDLPTAFIARIGNGSLHVALCAEYDALPEVGHACGHNIIAAAALGAGLILKKMVNELDITLHVIGTPAEENGGGKILMLERGAFHKIHAAIMIHPAPYDILEPNIIAAHILDISYTGKASHASAFPELGINAADALTIAQTAIGLLRQQIKSTDRIHGIITKGGDAPNIIPASTTAKYIVRSKNLNDLDDITKKVIHCFEAGALATGATLHIKRSDKPYAHMKHDQELAALFQKNAEMLGRKFITSHSVKEHFSASTDMGNISLSIPSIHPTLGIDSGDAVNHQPEFAERCNSPSADQAVLDGALAMAWTLIDMAQDKTRWV